jgi:sterol desaturase/sphingolipid hydroxylase (fatty acid hydroxylase superfamily)
MLTEEDKGFIEYWEQNRLRKKKIWRQLSVGMPLGVALAGAILVNVYSGWNPAGTILQYNSETLFVVLIAVLLIVVFVVIFSARHRWDMNEQHYKELLAKKDKL